MPEPNVLILEILKQDSALKMSVFEKNELASTLRHYSLCAVSFAEIEKFCQEIISLLNKDKQPADDVDFIRDLQKTGQLLWEHLFTRPIKERLKSTQITDLVLSIDEELINIPWELLYDGRNFLCLNFNLGRVVRTKEQITQPRYRASAAGTPRMLILANPTNDLKSAYEEGVFIKNQFDRKRKEVSIDFKSTSIDTLYVKKNLRDYDLVHFAGHCEYDPVDPGKTGWVFSDNKFSAQDILAMGENFSFPSLIFSNACYSAKAQAEIIDRDCQRKSYSLASAFLFSGVRHYIGSLRKIEDPVSLEFSQEFYKQLISGKAVGESIRLGRLKLIKEYGLTAMHWASYILYGDPNFSLFAPGPRKDAGFASKFRRRFKEKFLNKRTVYPLIFSATISVSIILLCFWLPSLNPNTYHLFSASNKMFKSGDNQGTISTCDLIIKKDPLFLAAYPLQANAFQRLGNWDKAIKCYFDYAFYSEKKHDKKSHAAALVNIGWFYQLNGQYPKAYEFYNKALNLSRENKDILNEACALRKLAVWHMDKEEYDQALELLTKSSEINRERQHLKEHRYNLACDYFNMGLLFTDKDDYKTAKDFYAKSLKIFERLDLKNELSDYYFNRGEIYRFEKQYQKALECYDQGLKIDSGLNNSASLSSDYNMIGELYMEMGNLQEAEKNFLQSLDIANKIGAPLESASANYDLGLLYKTEGKKNKAREFLRNAEEIYAEVDTPDYKDVKQELLDLD